MPNMFSFSYIVWTLLKCSNTRTSIFVISKLCHLYSILAYASYLIRGESETNEQTLFRCVSQIRVSIFNYQLFRHVEQPGWKLSWDWPGNEIIWEMWGAETTEQGDCSAIKGDNPPHCCEKEPVLLDLLPGAPYNKQVANCCKGGVLTSMTQDPMKYVSSFEMSIGSVSSDGFGTRMPENFTLGIPGYTCGVPVQVPPTKFYHNQRRRTTQAVGK